MKKIPVITRNEELIETIKKQSAEFSDNFDFIFFTDKEETVTFLNYEVPEIKILDFTDDSLYCGEIADVMRKDSWLHPCGIIALVHDEEEKQLMEEKQDQSLLMVMTRSEFTRNLDRLLSILKQNSHFLFSRRMQQYLSECESGTLKCDNEPLDVVMYANLLSSYLYNTNRIDKSGRYRLKTALTEMLFNALEHGNCGITYEQKNKCLEHGGSILSLIAERNKDPDVASRKILISYEIFPERTRFSITDDGKGFDWRNRIKKQVVPGMHGMGIKMTANFVKKLAYNDSGNQVLFEIENQEHKLNAIPAIFADAEVIEYAADAVVSRENEASDDLFFILSGQLEISACGKQISLLTPKDIFIGEMSFLLGGRRSATICTVDRVRLIRIPKNEFMRLICLNPHYGIFLAKLLAQRLTLLNQRYVSAGGMQKTAN